MEESKELQGFYKIFRAVIYISVLMEFFEYAIDPRAIDGFGGVVCDLHDRIKQWFIYHDGNLVYSKVVTFLLVCITCVGTRNKKHLEFDARKQVLYPLVSGVLLLVLSVCGSSAIRWTLVSIALRAKELSFGRVNTFPLLSLTRSIP